MATNEQLISALVLDYLKKRDKNLAKVFQQKTNAVCIWYRIFYCRTVFM